MQSDAEELAFLEVEYRDGQFCGGVFPPTQNVFATHSTHTPPLGPEYPGPHTHALADVLCAGEYELARHGVLTELEQNVFSRHAIQTSSVATDGTMQTVMKHIDTRRV